MLRLQLLDPGISVHGFELFGVVHLEGLVFLINLSVLGSFKVPIFIECSDLVLLLTTVPKWADVITIVGGMG